MGFELGKEHGYRHGWVEGFEDGKRQARGLNHIPGDDIAEEVKDVTKAA